MWRIIYNILSFAAFPFFVVFACFSNKIRANYFARLHPETVDTRSRGAVWLHAASVGEVVIADNLITHWKTKNINEHFFITTNTHYACEMARKKLPHVPVCPAPFDLIWSVRRFLNIVKPSALIIIETEIWPNLIWESKSLGIPIIIVNGRISDRTLATYKRFSFFFRTILCCIDLVLAQSEEQSKRFNEIGMSKDKIHVSGNVKYYREVSSAIMDRSDRRYVTFGSIREKETEPITDVIQKLGILHPELSFVVAPREMPLVESIFKKLHKHFPVTLYSNWKGMNTGNIRVILVDTVGDLFSIYRESVVAFVGGSLAPYGGQNVLEPLFFGTPVLFGPYTENFQDIAENILTNKAGFRISSGPELLEVMSILLDDTEQWDIASRNGLEFVIKQRDIIEDAIGSILRLVNNPYV